MRSKITLVRITGFVLVTLASFTLSHSADGPYIGGRVGVIVEYTLPPSTEKEFEKVAGAIKEDPYKNPSYYTQKGKDWLRRVFPADLCEIIEKMKSDEGADVLLIHNFPIDQCIPPTPEDGNKPISLLQDPLNTKAKGFISEAAILAMVGLLGGRPIFDENEKDGTYINQVIPLDAPKYKAQQSSFGSSVEFEPHTENVYQEPPLKFFSLTCLRGDPKVGTYVIFFNDIIQFIERKFPHKLQWVLKGMRKNAYTMRSGPSFENTLIEVALPILEKRKEGTVFRLNLNKNLNKDRTEGNDPEAKEVVRFLRDVINSKEFKRSYRKRIVLKKGDYLLFNNWKIMHARGAFELNKKQWRWLQRCYFLCE